MIVKDNRVLRRQKGKLTDSTSEHNNTSLFSLRVVARQPKIQQLSIDERDECQSPLRCPNNSDGPTRLPRRNLTFTSTCAGKVEKRKIKQIDGDCKAVLGAPQPIDLADIENFFFTVEQKRLTEFRQQWNFDIATDSPSPGKKHASA